MPWIICTVTCLEEREKADTHGDGRILDHIQKGKKRPGWCQLSEIRKGMGTGGVLILMWKELRGAEHKLQCQAAGVCSTFLMNLQDATHSLLPTLSDLLPSPIPVLEHSIRRPKLFWEMTEP